MTEKKLLDVKDMAKRLGVNASWLYRRTSEGTIPFIKMGKYVRFDPDEVMAHLRKDTNEPKSRSSEES